MTQTSRKKPLVPPLAGAALLLTAVSAGAGLWSGAQLAGTVETSVAKRIEAEPLKFSVDPAYLGDVRLKKLAPIVTNLKAPADTWVRLEASILFDAKNSEGVDALAGDLTEDMLGFLRTVSAQQLEGASGLQHLREDLSERVAIRSQGQVRDIVIETLVVQ